MTNTGTMVYLWLLSGALIGLLVAKAPVASVQRMVIGAALTTIIVCIAVAYSAAWLVDDDE